MGKQYETKHGNSKKTKGKNLIIILFLLVIIIGIFIVIKNNNNKDNLEGSWTTDGVTIYEFNGKGNGVLKVPKEEYKFSYAVNSDKLYIDFVSIKAKDSDYEYTLQNDILTLKGIKGTTGIYTLIKNFNN